MNGVETGLVSMAFKQANSEESGFFRKAVQSVSELLAAESHAPDCHESADMRWLVEHSAELAQYKGEWLLIHEGGLVLHDNDFDAVRAAIGEREIRSPFVYYVPTDSESNSITI
jgi:hypothetical protein